MITGFNTDIEYQGTTYHVQTEDKGLETPLILSLVYQRGTILASKRSPYDDLLTNFDEKVLVERLNKQHKLICAAIRAGRIEDLKRMTVKDAENKRAGLVVQKEVAAPEIKVQNAPPLVRDIPPAPVFKDSNLSPRQAESNPEIKKPPVAKPPQIGKPTIPVVDKSGQPLKIASNVPDIPAFDFADIIAEENAKFPEPPKKLTFEIPAETEPEFHNEPIIEAVEIIEEEILPADAVAIIGDMTQTDAPADNRMKINILGSPEFRSGEKKTLSISIHRGSVENGIADAHIMIKVIGATFRPLIFHGKTDSNGIAVVHLQMPLFKAGRAAVLIKAMSGGEEVEYRKTISQR